MNTYQAKAIPISQVLARLGFEPHHTAKGEKWYLSPFRQETEPSFKLTANEKGWFDHGLGSGGNILDFVMAYYRLSTVSDALAKLDDLEGWQPVRTAVPEAAKPAEKELDTPISVSKIQPLQNRALVQYLQSRGIEGATARPYVQEIYYTHNYRKYFALAFPNRSGGYELRNPYFKGAYGTKDITLIALPESGQTASVSVFEGFMDFLSALTHFNAPRLSQPALVLNSTAMRDRAIETIREMGASVVYSFFDHDAAGRELTGYFQRQLTGVQVIDQSGIYQGHKDFNAMLEKKRQHQHC